MPDIEEKKNGEIENNPGWKLGCAFLAMIAALVLMLGQATCNAIVDTISEHPDGGGIKYDPSYDYYQKSNSDHKTPYGKSTDNRLTPDNVKRHAHSGNDD